MEIWMLPKSEVMGTNIVGEERNEPNHSPVLPTPEEGRSIIDLDALLDALGAGFDLLGGLLGGLMMKMAIAGGNYFKSVIFILIFLQFK